MAGETQIEQVQDVDGRPIIGNLREDLGELAHDVITLAELQAKLFVEDARIIAQSARRWAIVLVAAALIALASLPVAVLGIAYLVSWTGLDLALSMLLVSLILLGAMGAMIVVSARRLKGATEPLQRSAEELQRNVEWVKQRLTGR
jgi:hypothetical protein